jgi:2'-5' RNA ligase
MEQLDIFGSEIHEYLFVIEPDQPTKENLLRFRELVNHIVPLSEEILHSKPHISVCYFKASDFSNDFILTKTSQILSSVKSFDIQLKGSEMWKNGTLVLKVNPNESIRELQKQLSNTFKGVIKNFHLTIARSIPTEFLDKIPIEHFEYQGEFNCSSIYILKKKENEPYQLLGAISLNVS